MPPSKMPETLIRLETKLDALTVTVADVKEKLYGNGKPGIIVDQVVQSEQIAQLLAIAKTNADGIAKLREVSAPTWIGKNWFKIIGALTLFFVIVHSLLPADITVWQALQLLK